MHQLEQLRLTRLQSVKVKADWPTYSLRRFSIRVWPCIGSTLAAGSPSISMRQRTLSSSLGRKSVVNSVSISLPTSSSPSKTKLLMHFSDPMLETKLREPLAKTDGDPEQPSTVIKNWSRMWLQLNLNFLFWTTKSGPRLMSSLAKLRKSGTIQS